VRIPKRTFRDAIKGEFKSLPVANLSLGGVLADRVLWVVSPRRLPGWVVSFRSSHNSRATLRHLLLKFLFQNLNRNEMVVCQMLAVKLPDEEYSILEKILSNPISMKNNLGRILTAMSDYNYLELRDPGRYFWSFEPSLVVEKHWFEEIRIPPKRYIGVGYNDKGTLSTALSWKEQLTEDGENHSQALLLSRFDFLLSTILHPGFPTPAVRYNRPKSPKKDEMESRSPCSR